MTTRTAPAPQFCAGIQHFGKVWEGFPQFAKAAAIQPGESAISDPRSPDAVYQTLLMADALRYLTLQTCGSKGSGHPGGFASSAEAYASLVMLGYTNIVTEVGHHAPGFYSAMFLDTSLEEMGIRTVADLMGRFREKHGLLGHLSGAIPGLLAPAGPLGQGQHFAMAGALLHPGKLFPVTIGDGGMGEPYVLNSMLHFNTAYPKVTNFLPTLIWNGYSQEHHSMVSRFSNEEMIAYWKGHGFKEVVLVDAKEFDDTKQTSAYADSSCFSHKQRLAFAAAVLAGDMVFLPVFEARDKLEADGYTVRIVAIVNPRRLYRATDISWDTVAEPDNKFMDDAHFNALFDGDVLLAVSGGPSAVLEPVLLRTRAKARDTFAWKRGETTASPAEIMEFNGLTADAMAKRVKALLG